MLPCYNQTESRIQGQWVFQPDSNQWQHSLFFGERGLHLLGHSNPLLLRRKTLQFLLHYRFEAKGKMQWMPRLQEENVAPRGKRYWGNWGRDWWLTSLKRISRHWPLWEVQLAKGFFFIQAFIRKHYGKRPVGRPIIPMNNCFGQEVFLPLCPNLSRTRIWVLWIL